MSNQAKGRYEVQKIIRTVTLNGLTAMGMSGWDCMEQAQANFTNADKIVTMRLMGTRRRGWQGTEYAYADSALTRTDDWIEEQRWQFQILLKRTNEETINSILPEDAGALLVSWFNGKGNEQLRKNGISNLKIDGSEIIVYNDTNFLFQKRAVFTMKVQVPKAISFGETQADVLVPRVKPV